MIAIQLDDIAIGFGAEPIFSGLALQLHDDRKVGLVGANGCGKSTLLKLVGGHLTPDEGAITRRKGLTLGYLAQEPLLNPGSTVWQEAFSASQRLGELELALEKVEAHLSDPAVYGDERQLSRALERQTRLLDEYTRLGGLSYEGLVRSTLLDVGFTEEDFPLRVSALSGGQKKLLGLARLLLVKPDYLLLDEPDNHLDLEGKALLEKVIRAYAGGVMIVSHDRYLLDLVVEEIIELENGRVETFSGGYSEYAFEKELRRARLQQLFQAQQKEIHRLEQAAARLMTWGKVFDNEKFSKRGKNILARLEHIERVDRPYQRGTMKLEIQGARSGDKVLEISKLSKSFAVPGQPAAERTILSDVDLLLMRGERVGLVGQNGAGKSLLFRMILGQETPGGGQIKLGPSTRLGYYAQQHETLDPARTLIENVRNAGRFTEESAVAFLLRFLFTYEQARGPVTNLSGGERSRLQLALLMLSQPNLLLLDEPTNNLDIASIEVLEAALEDFNGSLLVISHDRYFLDRVVQRVVELETTASEYPGNYSDYITRKDGKR
jgi:ATP-binding cassette subfamily F protein 3